jgi:hypothetical protein
MMVDITLKTEEDIIPEFRDIFRKLKPKKIKKGYYRSLTWNDDLYIKEKIERYPELKISPYGVPYGVCDSPKQFEEKYGQLIKQSEKKFFVSFVRLQKKHESPTGGWRWHKWGPYIGKQKPKCEYLYDEPIINEVYTYHIYEVVSENEDI